MDMTVNNIEAFKVGDWIVEPSLLRISKAGEERKLELRSMEILLFLVANKGKVVSKQELHDAVWGDIFVTDNALTRAISRLRKSFDDDPLNPSYIDTISKSGYRLVAPVTDLDSTLEHDGYSEDPASQNTGISGRILVGAGATVFIVTILSLVSMLGQDSFSGFYDPVPISTLIGPEMEAVISPDGEKISFSYAQPGDNNVDVYIKLLEDQSQIKFTNHQTPQGFGVWSPDGKYMAYASLEDGTCGIYKEPEIGGKNVRLGSCFSRPRDLVWSPDGNLIAFADARTPQSPSQVFFLNANTNEITEITKPEGGAFDRDPVFSPNGNYLVFNRKKNGSHGDIFKMNLESKELTQITFDNASVLGLDIFDDGKKIAFSSNRGGQRALWSVSFAGGLPTRFHINERVPTHPKFAVDKKRMIYKSNIDQTHLWLLDIADSESVPRQIVGSSRAELHPSISDDGSKVVFISNRTGGFEIWGGSIEENNPSKLTSLGAAFMNMPSWSPDQTEIVFDARVEEDNRVYILDVASKSVRTFVNLGGDQVNARYSRDGKYIYFASNHTGEWQIWKKPVLGDVMEQVTDISGYHLQESLMDDALYFVRNDTSGIWKKDMSKEGEVSLAVPGFNPVDWGSWALTQEGIVYLDRSNGSQLKLRPYGGWNEQVLYTASKPIQFGSPVLTVTPDVRSIILAQIERREDEIMMIDFD